MRKIYTYFLMLCVILSSLATQAQNNFFTDISEKAITHGNAFRSIKPIKFRSVSMNEQEIKSFLWALPSGKSASYNRNNAAILSLPRPDGTTATFRVWESSIQEPGLEAKFPEIKTFAGQGIDDPYATIRFDLTPRGFHAQVLSTNGAYYIDPYAVGITDSYISYYRQDLHKTVSWTCDVQDAPPSNPTNNFTTAACRGPELRTYRLAVACTGEYAQAPGISAGANPATLHAAIVTSVNRVVGVYEKEVAVSMILIANNNIVEYLNAATDPFTGNNNANVLINESQTVINANIGAANYDIGHTFSTGGGGLAQLNSPCGTSKARGITGSPFPTGDAYDIDYVAHEMGHQFGGNHTMNGCGSSPNSTKYEPGSGTTIQAYAGICGAQDIQPNSDPMFHAISFDEISNFVVTGGGSTCGVISLTGNGIPVVGPLPSDMSIPVGTPFTLTGTATDPNGDAMTYCWEQWDLGNPGAGWNIGAGPGAVPGNTAPLFKSRLPKTTGSRTFPDMAVILAGYPAAPPAAMGGLKGEVLSQVARPMKFRLTVRDNRAGGGGVASSGGGGCQSSTPLTITAVGTVPFAVTVPNGGESYPGNSSQTVTWNVAGTTGAPVSVANVRILLSTDNGATYPTELIASTANDGSEPVTIPNIPTTTARIKIEAVGNVFFDISNQPWTITVPLSGFSFNTSTPGTVSCNGPTSLSVALGTTATGGFTTPINLTATGVPAGTNVTFSVNPLTPGNSTNVILNNINTLGAGTYNINITGVAGTVTQNTTVSYVVAPGAVTITTQPVNVTVCLPSNAIFSIVATGTGLAYQWQVSTDGGATFTDIPGATSAAYIFTPTAAMNGNQYRVMLSGTCTTGSVASNIVTLTINSPVSITTQPVDMQTCTGNDVTFVVASTSSSPQFITYQWQVSVNGGAFVNIAGATGSTLTVPGNLDNDGNVYHVIVSGPPCGSVTSDDVTLTVNQRPGVILAASEYTSITPYVRTSLYATVSPSGPTYFYEWYRNGIVVSGTDPGMGSIPVDVDGLGEYTVMVTDSATGCGRMSNLVRITDSAAAAHHVFVYPNPSTGQFQVRYYSATTAPTTHMLTVYDSKGARVWQKVYPVSRVYDRMDVNLDNASSGIYLIELRDASGKRLASSRIMVK